MIVFFTDSYHRTGSRSFSKTCIHEVYNAEVLVPRFLFLFCFLQMRQNMMLEPTRTNQWIWEQNLGIGIHLDQILPEEGDWIVNTSAQTFHLQQGVVLIQQFYIKRHLGQKPTLTNSFHSSSLTSPLTALGQNFKFRPLESMPTLEECCVLWPNVKALIP